MDIAYLCIPMEIAYLLGAIPTSVLFGQAFYGIDIRQYGSGNAGASNTFRILGKKAGVPVLLIDIAKGWTAANLAYFLDDYTPGTAEFVNIQLLLGMVAVIGHIFPIFVEFKGGKGIATLLGMVLAIHFQGAMTCFVIFFIFLAITRYVSLSSIISIISFPLLILFVFNNPFPSLVAFGIAASILVIVTHFKNIKRLIAGTENKAHLPWGGKHF